MKRSLKPTLLDAYQGSMAALPNGWLTHVEASILRTAVKRVAGCSVLEIGSWVGRSTCVIADAVGEDYAAGSRFDVIDFGITGPEEWEWRFGSSVFAHQGVGDFVKPICFPGGVGAVLKQNLVDRGLNKFVRAIILGDVLDMSIGRRYAFVFCDCAHDAVEIERNLPAVRGLLTDDFILVCDDVATHEAANMVAGIVGADSYCLSNEFDVYSKLCVLTKGRYEAAFFE